MRLARYSLASFRIAATLTNPAVWLLGLSLGLLNACRYGFIDWGIAHLHEVQGDGIGKAYGTAIALVILQLPYKYLPVYQR